MPANFSDKMLLALTPVKLTDKLFFTKNLKLMIHASMPLTRALESLRLQTENKRLRSVLTAVHERIQKGDTFSDALRDHPRVFSEIFVNMVRAAEESGKLEEALETLALQMSKEHKLKSEIKGALAYPIVVLTVMIIVTTGLMVFVVPNLIEMLITTGVPLPLPTRILVAVSDFMVHYSYLLVIFLVASIIFFIRIRKTRAGKAVLHKIVLHMPVFGKLAQKVNLARSCRALASLLKTDIPVVESFIITSQVIANVYYKEAFLGTAEKLKKGVSIHEAINTYASLFTPTVVQMIAVGEETGTVDEILGDVALFYEEELDNNLKNLPSLLEPILILILGVTVGGIAVSIMMPIFSLTQGTG